MAKFRVDINGTIFEDDWRNIPGAVMGALRRYENRMDKAFAEEWEKKNPGKHLWMHVDEMPSDLIDDIAIVIRRVKE